MDTFSQEVFDGNQLWDVCQYHETNPAFYLTGKSSNGERMNISIGNQILSRHMLLLGGIGTGKSNAFNHMIRSIRNIMTQKDVAVIFDTKGDYYREFYRSGDIVISNDDRADGGNGPDYWNLFNEITIDDRIEENILEISKNFFSEKIQNSSQPFFPNAAKDLFSAVLLNMVRSKDFSALKNNKILRSTFDCFSVSAMKRILDCYPDLKAMRSYIDNEKSDQTQGIVAELQQLVREILVGNFKKNGTLSMRQLIRNKGGKVIFIEYDLGIGSMLTPVYRLLIDLAIKEALCRTTNEGHVYFFIDEFRLLPRLEHIDDGVNFGRSLGAKFFVGVQNIAQIADAYGENRAHSILSGFGTTVAFRVNDAESREYIKNLFGRNIKLQTYLSAVQNRGICEQIRDGYVVEDTDITNLPVGQAIVGAPGCQPFRFQFKLYE